MLSVRPKRGDKEMSLSEARQYCAKRTRKNAKILSLTPIEKCVISATCAFLTVAGDRRMAWYTAMTQS